jgi:hypothetical protein
MSASLAAVMAAVSIAGAAVWICRYRYAEEKPEPESELYDKLSIFRQSISFDNCVEFLSKVGPCYMSSLRCHSQFMTAL